MKTVIFRRGEREKGRKGEIKTLCFTLLFLSSSPFLLFSPTSQSAAQTGGNFTITQSVIASGGAASAGGNLRVEGTVGQNIAGAVSIGGANNQYSARGGFWTADALAPTSAHVSISGQIRTADGRGIRGTTVTLTDLTTNEIRSSHSSSFGYYRFEEVPAGRSYVLTVGSKRFTFNPNTQIVTLLETLTDADFTAAPE